MIGIFIGFGGWYLSYIGCLIMKVSTTGQSRQCLQGKLSLLELIVRIKACNR